MLVFSWDDLKTIISITINVDIINFIDVHPSGDLISLIASDEIHFFNSNFEYLKALKVDIPATCHDEGNGFEVFEWNLGGTLAATTFSRGVIFVERQTLSQAFIIPYPEKGTLANYDGVQWFPDGRHLFVKTEDHDPYFNLDFITKSWAVNPIERCLLGFFREFYERDLDREFGPGFHDDWRLEGARLGGFLDKIYFRDNFHELVVEQTLLTFIFTVTNPEVIDVATMPGVTPIELRIRQNRIASGGQEYHGTRLAEPDCSFLWDLEEMLCAPVFQAREKDDDEWEYESSLYQSGFYEEHGHIIRLCFSDMGLLNLPDSIGNLSSVQWIDLSENRLSSIPKTIGRLNSLIKLNLSKNRLTCLPPSLGGLTLLEVLDLDYNNLISLPDSVGNLSNLRVLSIRGNHLLSLPVRLGDLQSLKNLQLGHNELKNLPDSIGLLVSLQILDLRINHLSALPDSIVQLRSLKEFAINRNPDLILSRPVDDWMTYLENTGCEILKSTRRSKAGNK